MADEHSKDTDSEDVLDMLEREVGRLAVNSSCETDAGETVEQPDPTPVPETEVSREYERILSGADAGEADAGGAETDATTEPPITPSRPTLSHFSRTPTEYRQIIDRISHTDLSYEIMRRFSHDELVELMVRKKFNPPSGKSTTSTTSNTSTPRTIKCSLCKMEGFSRSTCPAHQSSVWRFFKKEGFFAGTKVKGGNLHDYTEALSQSKRYKNWISISENIKTLNEQLPDEEWSKAWNDTKRKR